MIDGPADVFIVAPIKLKEFSVMKIEEDSRTHDYSKYIGEDSIPLIEIICEDGVFLVVLPKDEYIKLD